MIESRLTLARSMEAQRRVCTRTTCHRTAKAVATQRTALATDGPSHVTPSHCHTSQFQRN